LGSVRGEHSIGSARPAPSGRAEPFETVYRAAGLLLKEPEAETFAAEIVHKLKLIKSPVRRKTALRLLKALIDEEENEGSLN
jgi:hypothetical protein